MSVLKTQGVGGLYKGLEPTLWRNGTWNALYFATIGLIKDRFIPPNSQVGGSALSQAFVSFLYGTIAGLFATSINTPLDLVKSRIQLGVHEKYKNTWQTFVVIVKEEGLAKLWRGLPLRLLRMGLGGGVTMCVYEFVTKYIQGNKTKT